MAEGYYRSGYRRRDYRCDRDYPTVLFGIIIIMNSKSNLDSALKCFVFFLISQPLVYLIQVPFSELGWQLFGYYRYWFMWTLLCFPMGFVGYWMKKDKWWGYLILLPMIALTAMSYATYFSDFLFYLPRFILLSVFCAAAMILYPVVIFKNRAIKAVGAAVGGAAVIAITVFCLLNPPVYLADDSYGNVKIVYMEDVEDYMLHADFRKGGDTVLTVASPKGEKTEYDLHIERNSYEVTKKR